MEKGAAADAPQAAGRAGGGFGSMAPVGADSAAPQASISLDDALRKSIGQFGWGQRIFYTLTQAIRIPAVMQTILLIYLGLDPVTRGWFTCNQGAYYRSCQAVLNDPWATMTSPQFCSLPDSAYEWTSDISATFVVEFGVLCGNAWQINLGVSVFFAGFLLGGIMMGHICDVQGRKSGLLGTCILCGTAGMLTAFAPGIWAYIVLRFVAGLGVAGSGVSAFVLGLEYVGPDWRGRLGVVSTLSYSIATMIVAILAYALNDWRALAFWTAVPALACAVAVPFCPESPRWQLAKGKNDAAKKTLSRLAWYNGTSLPKGQIVGDKNLGKTGAANEGFRDVIRHPRLRRRLAAMAVIWMSSNALYYGVFLLTASLPGNVYINMIIVSFSDFPASILPAFIVDHLGRRVTTLSFLLVGSAASILIFFVPASWIWSIGFAVLASFGASATLSLNFLYSAELFPTSVRSLCISICAGAGRIGGISIGPITFLGSYIGATSLSWLILGLWGTVSCIMLIWLPETQGISLPNSIAGMSFKPSSTIDLPQPAGALANDAKSTLEPRKLKYDHLFPKRDVEIGRPSAATVAA